MSSSEKKMSDSELQREEIEVQAESEGAGEASNERARTRRRRRSLGTESSVNMDELRELIHLTRENEFTEFELEREGFHVRFRRGPEGSEAVGGVDASRELAAVATNTSPAETRVSSASAPTHPGAKAQTEASEDQDLYLIPSPIVGTFYRAASPNADSFVKIGSAVEPDTVVCIIEAMKLMNEIQAETTGEVAKIYVENGQPVEYGQPLFGIKK